MKKIHIQVYDEFFPSMCLAIYDSYIFPLIGDSYRFDGKLYTITRRELLPLDTNVINIWCVSGVHTSKQNH